MPGWVEANGGPANTKRGFTTEDFISESQIQQMSVSGRPPVFGADLPDDIIVVRPKDVFYPSSGPSSKTWATATQSMSKDLGKSVYSIVFMISFIERIFLLR